MRLRHIASKGECDGVTQKSAGGMVRRSAPAPHARDDTMSLGGSVARGPRSRVVRVARNHTGRSNFRHGRGRGVRTARIAASAGDHGGVVLTARIAASAGDHGPRDADAELRPGAAPSPGAAPVGDRRGTFVHAGAVHDPVSQVARRDLGEPQQLL
jgi:hypothetical protein